MKPVQWKENQREGQKLLNTISTDSQELQSLLGTDYTIVATQLGVESASAKVGPSTSITSRKKKRSEEGIEDGGGQTRAKKPKTDPATRQEGGVIDLTSPSP